MMPKMPVFKLKVVPYNHLASVRGIVSFLLALTGSALNSCFGTESPLPPPCHTHAAKDWKYLTSKGNKQLILGRHNQTRTQ